MWRGESDSGRFHSLSILRDTKREAERLGLPLGMVADPVGMPTERGLAVLHYAIEQGKGAEFLESFLRRGGGPKVLPLPRRIWLP